MTSQRHPSANTLKIDEAQISGLEGVDRAKVVAIMTYMEENMQGHGHRLDFPNKYTGTIQFKSPEKEIYTVRDRHGDKALSVVLDKSFHHNAGEYINSINVHEYNSNHELSDIVSSIVDAVPQVMRIYDEDEYDITPEKLSFDRDREFSEEKLQQTAQEYINFFEKNRVEYGEEEYIDLGKFIQQEDGSAVYMHQRVTMQQSDEYGIDSYEIRSTATDLDNVTAWRNEYPDDDEKSSIQVGSPTFPLNGDYKSYDNPEMYGDKPFSFIVDENNEIIITSFDPRLPLPKVPESYDIDYHSSRDYRGTEFGSENQLAAQYYVDNLISAKINELNIEEAGTSIDSIYSLVKWGNESGNLQTSSKKPTVVLGSSVRAVEIEATRMPISGVVRYDITDRSSENTFSDNSEDIFSFNFDPETNNILYIKGFITPLMDEQLSAISTEYTKVAITEPGITKSDVDNLRQLVKWGNSTELLKPTLDEPTRIIDSSVRLVTIEATEKPFGIVQYSIKDPDDTLVFNHDPRTDRISYKGGSITPLMTEQLEAFAVENRKYFATESPVLRQNSFVPFELKEPFVFQGLPEGLHKEATEVVKWIDSRDTNASALSPNGFTGFEGIDYDTAKCYTLQSPEGKDVFQVSVLSSNTADKTVFRVDKFDAVVINKELEAIKESNTPQIPVVDRDSFIPPSIINSSATRELSQLFSNLSFSAAPTAERPKDRDIDPRSIDLQDPLEKNVDLLKPRDLSGKIAPVTPKNTPKPKPKGIER